MSVQMQSFPVRLGDLPRPSPASRQEAARCRLMLHVQHAVHAVARRAGVESRTTMAGALDQTHVLARFASVTAAFGGGELHLEARGAGAVRRARLAPGIAYLAVEDAIAALLEGVLPVDAPAGPVDLVA